MVERIMYPPSESITSVVKSTHIERCQAKEPAAHL